MEPELESDAGDVNEFLLRIKELGDKRNREDEERVKNIEDEILAGRKARKAKREGMNSHEAENLKTYEQQFLTQQQNEPDHSRHRRIHPQAHRQAQGLSSLTLQG